ncbi:MAG: hypothetical protein U0694_25370 [Anaerolineae bacterium]
MGIAVFWDEVEPDIMRIDFSGEWTLQEQEAMSQKTRAMLGDRVRRSDVIISVQEGTRFPRLLPPAQIRRTVQSIPENPGVRVVVGAPMIMQTVLELFSGLIGGAMGVEMLNAATLEEARAIIRHKRGQ